MKARAISAVMGGTIVALVIAAVLVPTAGVSQTNEATIDTVTVTAAGTVEGRPDVAVVSLGIRVRGQTAQEAMNELSRRQNAVIDGIRALGLRQDDVTTGNIGLREFCRYDGVLERVVCRGFVANTSVRAETTDFDLVGAIIDAGIDGGATSVNNVSFDRTENNAAIREALAEAMDLARTKAEVLATRSGRQLGRAMIIEEGGARRPSITTTNATFGAGAAGGTLARDIVINPADRITRVRIVVTFALT
ncbi:MAG: SIMPL domain-containing protein [Actinomycetota bacterium]|nr:SIMPL domain-containing protein [Actinomycetota bacterium]